jgi:hypothetical protein
MGWRIIYDNNNVIELGEIFTSSHTDYNMDEFNTQEECFNKIDELQLTYQGLSGDTGVLVLFSNGTRAILDS